jgi:signal recognition particle GTPase
VVHKAIKPQETLFVDAMTGQDAVNNAARLLMIY